MHGTRGRKKTLRKNENWKRGKNEKQVKTRQKR